MKYVFLSLIIFAVIFEVLADILFKKWAIQNSKILFGVGLAMYLVATVFWAYSLKFEYLSKAATLFTVLNSILVAIAGVTIFKETLSFASKIGIALGIASIALLQL